MTSIEHIVYIQAAPERIYEALTTEKGLGEIWTRKCTVRQEIGFMNTFDFDEGYLTKMKVLELVENELVLWECVASDEEWVGTKIRFHLSGGNGKTKVLLQHLDWREMTDFCRFCNYHWAMFLLRLKQYLS